MSALVTLLNQSVDYAGLFPPAALDLETVTSNYADYRHGAQRWMLSRLVIPATRLSELVELAADHVDQADPWPLSVLVPTANEDKFGVAVDSLRAFAAGKHSSLRIASLETRANSAEEIQLLHQDLAAAPMTDAEIFIELPHAADPAPLIAVIGDLASSAALPKWKAKIRTGGVRPDLIPGADEVARFIDGCARHSVGLKATAGLHHPLRNEFNLTYETDSPRAVMHGFINLFVACGMRLKHELAVEQVESILLDTNAASFQFEGQTVRWREWQLESADLSQLRSNFLSSFGSCSFTEPVADLQQLGFAAALAEVAT